MKYHLAAFFVNPRISPTDKTNINHVQLQKPNTDLAPFLNLLLVTDLVTNPDLFTDPDTTGTLCSDPVANLDTFLNLDLFTNLIRSLIRICIHIRIRFCWF
jgi:hypothetical protein